MPELSLSMCFATVAGSIPSVGERSPRRAVRNSVALTEVRVLTDPIQALNREGGSGDGPRDDLRKRETIRRRYPGEQANCPAWAS